jgi:hypothetical protein
MSSSGTRLAEGARNPRSPCLWFQIGYVGDIVFGVGSYSIRARVRGEKSDLDVDEELLLNGGGVVGIGGELRRDVDAPLPDFRCSADGRADGLPSFGRPREDGGGEAVPELPRGGGRPRRQTVTAGGEPSMR